MAAGRSAARAPVGSDKCVLALDDALSRLAQMDRGKAKVVELPFFAGLSVEECAEALRSQKKRYFATGDWHAPGSPAN
jgi:ECF sigma factor